MIKFIENTTWKLNLQGGPKNRATLFLSKFSAECASERILKIGQ